MTVLVDRHRGRVRRRPRRHRPDRRDARSRRVDAAVRESSVVNRVTRLGGSPPTVLGLRFALEGGPGRPRRAGALRHHRRDGGRRRRRRRPGVRLQPRSPDRLALPIGHPLRRRHRRRHGGRPRGRDPGQPARRRRLRRRRALPVGRGREIDGHAIEDLRGSLDIGLQDGTVAAHARRDHAGAPGRAGPRRGRRRHGDRPAAGGEERELAVVGPRRWSRPSTARSSASTR